MTLGPTEEAKLVDLFRAIRSAVEQANGGEVVAEVQCKPKGGVLRWRVKPAWIVGSDSRTGLDADG